MTDTTAVTATPYTRRATPDSSVLLPGAVFSFLAEAPDTRDGLAVLEIRAVRGAEPPLHLHHREDEAFYLLDGEMTFYIGDAVLEATAGSFVYAPRGVPHGFRLSSETVRMLAFLWPAGGVAQFRELGEPAPSLDIPPLPAGEPDPEFVARDIAVMARWGVETVGPPPTA